MSETVSTFLLRRLRAWGVEQVFGYPGDGINGMFAAWAKNGAKDDGGALPRFVQARHEEMATFEAVGYAKFSGRLGACRLRSVRFCRERYGSFAGVASGTKHVRLRNMLNRLRAGTRRHRELYNDFFAPRARQGTRGLGPA